MNPEDVDAGDANDEGELADDGPAEKPKTFAEIFDLGAALSALANDSPAVAAQLDRGEAELAAVRQRIVANSRKNFILERELDEIDEKIKLLVKNRISVQEVQNSMRNSDLDEKEHAVSPLTGRRDDYEEMFFLLQTKPRYFARLTRVIESKEVPSFVQTVVFDMYGDQYDTREERLLLDLFKKVLQAELAAANDRGSLLRANTAITQMLSAYARRGQGLSMLKDVLETPIKELMGKKELNLELDPMKVYQQIIQDYETKTGKTSELPRGVDGAQAAQNPEVQALIAEREKLLWQYSDAILQRIIENAENVPYGMRWICKQLGVLCKQRFPDATRYQIGSLMGGYVYLRYFNPVIVNPDGMNLIKNKPNRVQRRNLILVAKVLQNLSNGLRFGDKEQYMKVMNSFIDQRRDPLMAYFDRLTAVDDLQDSLQVDKYLQHTHANSITISYNQIFLIHGLLNKHLDLVCSQTGDPMRAILKRLGTVPAQVKRDENRNVILSLIDRRKQRLSTAVDTFATTKDVNPLYHQAKALLLSVLRLLSPKTNCKTLLAYLDEEKKSAESKGDASLADHINNVCSMLTTLAGMNLLKRMETVEQTFDNFLWEVATEALSRTARIQTVEKRLLMVQSADRAIDAHHNYLLQRLDLYKMYLENVRKGGASEQASSAKGKEKKIQKLQMSHTDLVESGVIMSVDPSIPVAMLKKCSYVITMVEPGKFEITLLLKKGIEIKLLKKPIVVILEELLTMQEHGESRLPLENIDLNVNLLVHLLNSKFVAAK